MLHLHISGRKGDPLWSSVQALLHFDGADNATTTVDQKGGSWTFRDSAKISTPGKYGTARLNCTPGTGGRAWISGPTTVGQFGSGDFTIESWVKTSNVHSYYALFDKYNGASSGWQIYANNGYIGLYTDVDKGTATAGKLNDGQWHHLAIVRSGTTVKAYVDGVAVKTWTSINNNFTSATAFGIGGQVSTAGTYAAYTDYDDVRITAAARYLADFTPPSAAFPNQ